MTKELIEEARNLVQRHIRPMEEVARSWADASSTQEADKLGASATHLREASLMIGRLADALAAVPDAATAESERRAWAIAGHLERDREAVKAERDAALAAVERCREVAIQHRSVEQHNEMVPVTDIADLIREPSSADYLAALDGAPEPEVKP